MTPDRPALHKLRGRREFLAIAKGDKQVRSGLVLQARLRRPDSEIDAAAIRFGLTGFDFKKFTNFIQPHFFLSKAQLTLQFFLHSCSALAELKANFYNPQKYRYQASTLDMTNILEGEMFLY